MPLSVSAYNYGEHKAIGDQAFIKFISSLPQSGNAILFQSLLDFRANSENGVYDFPMSLNDRQRRISYGALNGLSGDHVSDPYALIGLLSDSSSFLQKIIALHNEYIAMGYTAAPDGKLVKLDLGYALLAVKNLSHFYQYGKSFQDQLRFFDKDFIRQCQSTELANAAFNQLNKTNAINMYVTLHLVAMDLAAKGGRLKDDPEQAKALLKLALLFNSFADHFLEDAFSAGHLVVKRTVVSSVVNNKSLHDFYSANGTVVVNKKGEIWKAHGDGTFSDPGFAQESVRVIAAVRLSLTDLWTAFENSASPQPATGFLSRIPEEKKLQANYLIDHIPCLQLVPIPYNSDLSSLFENASMVTDSMRKAAQILPYRNFIKSRVGNSVVVGINGPSFSTENYYRSFELRVNAGSISNRYTFNSRGGKKGVWDNWNGYTIVYSWGEMGPYIDEFHKKPTQQFRVGIRSNFDYWISDKKFIGVYGYTEGGIQYGNENTSLIFVPSIGLQLGSLLNINYYNMPGWLRLPAQYLLPLKFRQGVVLTVKHAPKYFYSFEMDFVL
ncbi:hypothetical protein [Chitinophaga defluvii]|uniref:Uncharacterized protein n=1 Tax=Chitinophaga defluvii TaxID=3163343 RepID=A0ABV2T802_9BACT